MKISWGGDDEIGQRPNNTKEQKNGGKIKTRGTTKNLREESIKEVNTNRRQDKLK